MFRWIRNWIDFRRMAKKLRYDSDREVRMEAATVLGRLKNPAAVQPLVGAIEDSEYLVREVAVKALGEIRDDRAFAALIAVLKDEKCDVRAQAAMTLGDIGDTRAVKSLIEALDFDDVKFEAISALVSLNDRRAVEPLIAMLKDSCEVVRWSVAEALGQLRDRRAAAPLIEALKDSNWMVRNEAANALKLLGWKFAKAILCVFAAIMDCDVKKCVNVGVIAIEPLITSLLTCYGKEVLTAANALRQLLPLNLAKISNAQLRRIKAATDTTYTTDGTWVDTSTRDACGYYPGGYHEQIDRDIDLSELRQLARQELIRRGEKA